MIKASPRAPLRHEWARLMQAAQGGDAQAYRQLLTDLRPWLARWLARRLPPADAEDVVQEVLVAIHTKRHTWAPDRPFGPWLVAIARYKWVDRLRRIAARAESVLDETLAGDGASHGDTVIAAQVLAELLARLKPAQADVIRLVKLQGFSIAEAAEISGQSEALVKVNIHRGLARLAAHVEGNRHGH